MSKKTKSVKIKRAVCHDCGCLEGQLHKPNCEMEECPLCGGQLISCECSHRFRNEKEWYKALDGWGLKPFIYWPNVCRMCCKLWPDLFMVPDEIWCHYIQPSKRDTVVCFECFNRIVTLIDGKPFKGPIRHI